jgi:hypothetical protein
VARVINRKSQARPHIRIRDSALSGEEQTKARAEGGLVGIGIATYAELTGIGSRISAAPGMPINTGTESATIRCCQLYGLSENI